MPKNSSFNLIIGFLVSLNLIVFGVAIWIHKPSFLPIFKDGLSTPSPYLKSPQAVEPETATPPKKDLPRPTTATLNTYFMGDVFWGRYMDDWAKASDLGYAYPFSGLDTFDKAKEDVWIANLECPITPVYRNSSQQEKILKFSCLPEYLPEASKWFEAFSLANNHTDNMQEVDGFRLTKDFLQQYQIQHFGHYDNAYQQEICEVVSFEGTFGFESKAQQEEYLQLLNKTQPQILQDYKQAKIVKSKQIPIALCGYHNVFRLPTQKELEQISKYSEFLPVVVMPHQGAEYGSKADSLQTKTFRQMVDKGADAVISGHTHTVHNGEIYKDKLIAYSVGNFIFDQQFSKEVTQSLIVNLRFDFEIDQNFEKWLELAPKCQKYLDDCLQQAKQKGLSKPKFEIKHDFWVGDSSNKLTKKADTATTKAVLDRVGL
jgi:poly-gamma-glutamate synthesis protein (capsule biosynthesis protein)